ncbi:hypothetical protein Taro_052848 [Colocasia esculenta]|uniref:Uncharacterized protein n=1 Tax=Colocasia esculenta TaxID=4460 RepID=A0A843XL98_COLES|nr:hypothetical protein [Colocasia esculenta]
MRSVSSILDTLTLLLELYVRLRERRQWDNDFALVVGGTDTSRCTGPQLVLFPVPHSRELRPESLDVPGMGLRQCSRRAASQRCWADASSSVVSFDVVPRGMPQLVTELTGLNDVVRHSWYQSKEFEMADRRDWGGGGDEPEESTQRMIERIWESLMDIPMRLDQ